MKKKTTAILLCVVLIVNLLSSVLVYANMENGVEAGKASGAMVTVELNPSKASPFNNGEFQGWGTSMGWWGNRIGYSEVLAQKAAELFYSEEGLSFDIVRYNVGGGDDPTHNHVTRSDSKIPCFKATADSEYDWNVDYNQVNVLAKIKQQNDNVHIEGYTNSPPWYMTISGCSGGGVNGAENLDPSKYAEFASFIADVTEHFEDIGLKFDSYSPMNEPCPNYSYWYALNTKQEGNHVAPGDHQSGLIIALSDEYERRGIDTLVAGLDETSIDTSITSFNALSQEAKSKLDRLDTHTYDGSARYALKQTAITAGKNLWMSEVDAWGGSGSNAGQMSNALNLAEGILKDMNGMQPSAWIMWNILDSHKDSQYYYMDEDGTKYYLEKDTSLNQYSGLWGVGMVNHDTQEIELTQKYYGFGQFSRYIQPGMTIIESSDSTLAAYDKKTGKIVIVALNTSANDVLVDFDMSAFTNVGGHAKPIRTSGDYYGGEHWAELASIEVSNKILTANLKANSITTYVIENDVSVDKFYASENEVTYEYTVPQYMEAYDKFFAIYDRAGKLKAIKYNDSSETISGDYRDCTYKLMIWDGMDPVWSVTSPVGYIGIDGVSFIGTGIGYKYELTGEGVSPDGIVWSVSDESIATVDDNGVLTAKSGGSVTLYAFAGDAKASIDIEVVDTDSYVTIRNKNSNLIIDTSGRSTADGASIVQNWDENYATSQWKIIPRSDGTFNLENRNTAMLMALYNGALTVTGLVDADDDNAKWYIIKQGSYYEIRSVAASLSLNVVLQSTDPGAEVIMYPFEGGNNELWSFEKCTGEPIFVELPKYKKIGLSASMVSGSTPWNNDASCDCTKTVDGNYHTYFDGLTEGYVLIDLGKQYRIDALGYVPRNGYAPRMRDGMFYGSTNGVDYEMIYQIPNASDPPFALTMVDNEEFLNGNSYRYIKYTVPAGQHYYGGNEDSYNCNIAEIELYGEAE